MKANKFKFLMLLGFALVIASGIIIAQPQQSESTISDEVEVSYSNMTDEDRVSMLTELRDAQINNGNTAAANYLQGRIDALKN